MYPVGFLCVAAFAACLVSVHTLGKDCSAPPSLSNGGHTRVGHVITYSCNAGYRLEGDRQLNCKDGDYWEGEFPHCKLILGEKEESDSRSDSSSSDRSESSSASSFKSKSSKSDSDSSVSKSSISSVSDSSKSSKSSKLDSSKSSKSDSISSKSDSSDSSKSDSISSKSDLSKSSKSDSLSSVSDSSKSSESDFISSKSDSISSKSDSSKSSKSDSTSSKSGPDPSKSNSGCEERCASKRCPLLSPPENCRLHVLGYYPGLYARYLCNYGYIHTGTMYRKCLHNGTWSGTELKCIGRTGGCKRLSNPGHGFVVVGPREVGSHAKYNCREGFYLSGPKFRECLESGWSDEAPVCLAIECDKLKAPRCGTISLSGGRYFNSTATYSCGHGYRLDESSGNKTRRCQNFGEWTGKAPKCNRITCRKLQAPPNGSVWPRSTRLYSRATYSCNSPHVLMGNRIRTCLRNGNWSGTAPRCVQKITCTKLQAPPNSKVRVITSGRAPCAIYSCKRSHVLVGNGIRTCQGHSWSGAAPRCVPKRRTCGRLQAPPNGNVQLSGTKLSFGAAYSCKESHVLVGDIIRTCWGNIGQWSGATPRCVPKTLCLRVDLKKPHHGTISVGVDGASGVATYSCNPRYTLQGDRTRVCRSGKWQGNVPTCIGIGTHCPQPAPLSNGKVRVWCRNNMCQAGFSCDSRYKVHGSMSAKCLSNQHWSNRIPTCIKK